MSSVSAQKGTLLYLATTDRTSVQPNPGLCRAGPLFDDRALMVERLPAIGISSPDGQNSVASTGLVEPTGEGAGLL
jgi:hypothetical protein